MPYRLWIIPPIWLAKLFLVRISDVISHRHGMRSNHEKRWSRQECDIFSHRNGLQVEHKGPYLPWKRSYETRSKSRRFWKEPWTYLKLQIVWKAVANNLAVSYSLVINCSKSSHCSMCDKSLNSVPFPHAKGNPNLLVMIFRKSVNFESQIAACDHRFHCDHPSRWPWMKWCSLRVSNRHAIDVINMGQVFDVVCYILFIYIYMLLLCNDVKHMIHIMVMWPSRKQKIAVLPVAGVKCSPASPKGQKSTCGYVPEGMPQDVADHNSSKFSGTWKTLENNFSMCFTV